jgi:hypothetical protein
VRPPHLHLCSGDPPFGIGQVEFGPFGFSEFARSHKDEGRESQNIAGRGVPLKAINDAEQGANGTRLYDRCAVGNRWSDQGAAEIACRIPLGSSRGDGKTKDGSQGTAQAGRSLMLPALLDLSQRVKDFRGLELSNRPFAKLLVCEVQ